MAALVLDRAGLPSNYVEVTSDRFVIGREADCELVLQSQFVSRHHAEVRNSGGKYELVDLGSSNGTSLNGHQIDANVPYELMDGYNFTIDEYSISFVDRIGAAKTLVRVKRAPDQIYVDVDAMEVWIGEKLLNLRQARVLKLLAYLYVNRGRVCSEDELGNHVWGREEGVAEGVPLFDSSSLHQLIYLARRAVEEYVLEHVRDDAPTVTNRWLDEAIQKLLPTHMQLIMGIGDAEELARAELKAEEQMARTVVLGSDDDAEPAGATIEVRCPVPPYHTSTRPRTAADPPVWTQEAFERLAAVPLVARPLARATVERFARAQDRWRITTRVMDDNKQAMIAADEFDAETMMGMFRELRARQIRAEAEGGDALSPEMRRFIEEAKAAGVSRCPIRDIEEKMTECPVDFRTLKTPAEAKEAVERLLEAQGETRDPA